MGRGFHPNTRVTLSFRNAHSSSAEIIATDASDGIRRRYSAYSSDRPCDLKVSKLLNSSWSIVGGIGAELITAQKTVSRGGRPFWLNKISQDGSYNLEALANFAPSKVWRYIANSLATSGVSANGLLNHGPLRRTSRLTEMNGAWISSDSRLHLRLKRSACPFYLTILIWRLDYHQILIDQSLVVNHCVL